MRSTRVTHPTEKLPVLARTEKDIFGCVASTNSSIASCRTRKKLSLLRTFGFRIQDYRTGGDSGLQEIQCNIEPNSSKERQAKLVIYGSFGACPRSAGWQWKWQGKAQHDKAWHEMVDAEAGID